ncbi:hypothetical protein GCM10027285_10880 [Oleiagrimonas citrea]|uniref:Uncharacterized protein n=1 Tax=Oleiagrimonas citrea TaxID=1665687 RepID=A0A846ZLL4_9GAMM|nr:hypothetical protein [Oleiagrimonas citrea]NKZ38351.1 hypothetical protein [Oleiagrimonas citrea]
MTWPSSLDGDFLERIGAENFARLVSVEVRELGHDVVGEVDHDRQRILLAPLCAANSDQCRRVFCHELAHLVTRGDGHGVRFLAVYATLLKRLHSDACPAYLVTLYEAQGALERASEAFAFASEFARWPVPVELLALFAVNRFGSQQEQQDLAQSVPRLVDDFNSSCLDAPQQ